MSRNLDRTNINLIKIQITLGLDGYNVKVTIKSNTLYTFRYLPNFFCCLVGPLLVPCINSNFGIWKMTFYLCIISYVFICFFLYFYVHTTRFFLLLGHLCMQKAGRERSRCFWTDIPCFSFRNRVALYC